MKSTRTAKLKLKVSPEQLRETFEACTQAFNFVCKVGYEDRDFDSVSLHKKTYYRVRSDFCLPAEMAVQMRMKSAESLKPAIKKDKKCPQSKACSIRYSHNSYNVWFDRQEVSVLTLEGRLKCGFYFPKTFHKYEKWRRKSAELIVRGRSVYLCVVFEKEIEDASPSTNPFILGIDRGVNKVAVCSDNTFFNGNINKVAHRYQRLRRNLQKSGTRSAKRHLKRLAQKENRFRRDVNHCISKKIVESLPKGSIIVLEDLKKIRQRVRTNKLGRRKIHSWSFYQLEIFLRYKSEMRGITLDYTDARYTSQKCSRCGHISRSNRKSQSVFKCVQCGFSLNADLNAARNIELNYRVAKCYPEGLSVNQPNVSLVEAKADISEVRWRADTSPYI